LKLLDSTYVYYQQLPINLIDLTDYTNPPDESANKPIPLAYGTFSLTKDSSAPVSGGIMNGIWVEPDKLILSDHVLGSVTNLWIYDDDLQELVEMDSGDYTVTLDDSGQTSITIDNMIDPTFTVYIYPETSDITHTDAPNYCIADDVRVRCYDRDNSKPLSIDVDSWVGIGPDDQYADEFYGRLKSVTPIGDIQSIKLQCDFTGNINPTRQTTARVRFWSDSDSQDIGDMVIEGTGAHPTYSESDISTAYITTYSKTLQDLTAPNGIWIHHLGDYLVGSGARYKLTDVYNIRLKVTYKRSIKHRSGSMVNVTNPNSMALSYDEHGILSSEPMSDELPFPQ